MSSVIWTIVGKIAPFFIKTFIINHESKKEALRRFHNFIEGRKSYSHKSKDIRKDAMDQREPERNSTKGWTYPEILNVNVEYEIKGKFKDGHARGVVVHYTSGRSLNGKSDAINTVKYLASQGLGALVMDKYGVFYKAKNYELSDVVYHAGKSEWNNVSGLSRYCIGIEICNAGKLLNSKSHFGERYSANEIRVAKKQDNVVEGEYHKFTNAQETSLINFILWQMDTNPNFSIDWVVGHDEISKGRKEDPGGSLSMTMSELRGLLKDMK